MASRPDFDAAAELLLQNWNATTSIPALPETCRPQSRAEGYEAAAAVARHSGNAVAGWKIAATSEAGQKHINVKGPMAGRILAETVIADGGTAPMAGNEMRVAEPEFAFRMRIDLPPRQTPYSMREVLDAVDTLHPAIEIPDSRFADFVGAGEAQLIADNACAHRFVLGPATTADWRAMDLIEHRPVLTLRGERFVGHGRNVLGDPRVALTWLANELRELGIELKAGRVVTTGTCHPPLPIQAGDLCAADFGTLGKVSVGFR